MVNSKQKGSTFEREVCVALSRLVDPDGTDTIFWRSAVSGGRATVQQRKGIRNKTQLGDITAVHDKGNWLTAYFMIECKFYAKLDLESFLFKGKGKLAEFWNKLNALCITHERVPLLIAKQNGLAPLLITNSQGYKKLCTFTSNTNSILTARSIKHFGYAHFFWFKELCSK